MKKNLKHNIFLLLLCCCSWLSNQAQQGFRNKAMLDSIPAPGFYQINLSPVVSAALQPDMRDIRIADASGKQVPYILKSDLPVFSENKFTELPVVSVKKEKDGQTHIIIKNTLARTLQELLLIIKNTDADRSVTLSGSDDNQQWFIIKEHIYLNSFFSNTSDRFVQSLIFPASSYHYFKIIINGKDVLPVNIVKTGVYEQSVRTGKYEPVPIPVVTQKDSSDKFSYVFVQFTDHYFIDRLVLQVKGPKFYNRAVDIYAGSAGLQQSGFTLSSEKEAILPVTIKTDRLLLKIRNDDNPPLQINAVTGFQLNRYLLAYLEKSATYQLLFADSTASLPVYDLENFKDSIAGNAAVLGYGIIGNNILPAKKAGPEKSNSKMLIWMAIGLAVFVLLLLSYKLTGEIKKSN